MKKLLIYLTVCLLTIKVFSQPANVYDRVEFSTEISTDLVATLQLATLKELWNKLDTSVVFREDVINTVAESGGAAAADFGSYDYIEITLDENTTITVSNISQGMTKWLKIAKDAGNTIAFSGATLIGSSDYINSSADDFYFILYNKDGVTTYCFPVSTTITQATTSVAGIGETATAAEVQTGSSSTVFVTPSTLVDADETNRGVLEVATSSEVTTGTADDKIITPLKLQDLIATTDRKGIAERATVTEAAGFSDYERFISPLDLGYVLDGLRIDILNIGDWDMDADNQVNIAHGLTYTDIRVVCVVIIDDGGTNYDMFTGSSSATSPNGLGGYISWSTTNIGLYRVPGGRFDNTSYNATSFNRGYIIILYLA